MWFSNALVYKCSVENINDIEERLNEDKLKPCPPHARFIYGWSSPFNTEILSQQSSACTLICLGKEERVLPTGVIFQQLEQHIEKLEAARGYKVKGAERRQLAEEIEFELLPKAFTLQKKLCALLDHKENQLIVNTTNDNQAAQLISLLTKSLPGIQIKAPEKINNLASLFTNWLKNPMRLPTPFKLASDCLLFSQTDDKKLFNCKGYDTPDEVSGLIEQGLNAAEISLLWHDRIQFTLTQDFKIKRIKCLDYLLEEFNNNRKSGDELQEQEANLTLLIGELRQLIRDMLRVTAKQTQPVQSHSYSMAV